MGPGERIRVLRVIARLNIGGPALHATLLTERLAPDRYDSLLVTGTEAPGEGNYLTLQQKPLDRLVVIPTLGREIRGLSEISAFRRLVQLMRQVRPHIVHSHTAKAGALARLAARLSKVPVIVHTYHGHVFHGYFSARQTRLFVAIERVLAGRTDCLLTVSETVRRELLGFDIGSPDRIRVMPLGLDLDRFLGGESARGHLRAELGLAPDTPTVGIVARLVPIKAHEVFLEAAARLTRRVAGAVFVIVGDGERRAALEAEVQRHGLRGRVHFLGWRRDLERIYADLDVVALSSRNEGSPVSLIEAMAAGRPVVSTRVGGVPDLIEDGRTGMLVAAGAPEALAEAIGALLANPDRARAMGEAGRQRVRPAFGAGRLLADMDRLYVELLGRKGLVRP